MKINNLSKNTNFFGKVGNITGAYPLFSCSHVLILHTLSYLCTPFN